MKRNLHSQNTGRSYGVVLLLAFGAAVFGIMTLHKLRDRRVCNLFVKEKERELDGLKHLLQKEREQAKETRRQMEDMKSNIHWLGTQKTDLDIKISEMKSTISSLKEEQRTIGVTLEEKQSEIKMLREKQMETKSDDSQVSLLSETLRQKDAEIEGLKHRLEFSPTKVLSVSADHPSNTATNFTTEAAGRRGNSRRRSGELHESINLEGQENSVKETDNKANDYKKKEPAGEGENTGKTGERFDNVKRKAGYGQSKQLATSQKDVPSSITAIFQTNKGQIQNTDNHKNKEESYLDEKTYTSETSKENEHDRNQVQKQNTEVGTNDKGVTKIEMQKNSNSRGTSRVSKDRMRTTRGKRRQIIAKHQVDESGMHLESRGIASMRNRKFLKVRTGTERVARVGGTILEIRDHQKDNDMDMDMDMRKKSDEEDYGIEMKKKIQQGEDSALQNNNQIRSEQGANPDTGRYRMQDVGTNHDDSPPGKTRPNPNNFADAEEGNQDVMKHDMTQKIEKEQEREVSNKETELLHSSQEEGFTNTALSKKSSITEEARNQKADEVLQLEEIISTIREDTEPRQAQNLSNSSEHVTIAERDVKEDDNQEVDYYQEPKEAEDHSGGSQDSRNQKPDNTARTEGETDRVREYRDQKHALNLHYLSNHVRTAERDLRDD
ncbi:intracellular protein transport protein USO1-like [Solanum lycopersicum]|nr:myosin-9-like [Solanum lycopersicum]